MLLHYKRPDSQTFHFIRQLAPAVTAPLYGLIHNFTFRTLQRNSDNEDAH